MARGMLSHPAMTHLLASLALVVALQSPLQITQQIDALVQQLKAALATGASQPTTAAALVDALAAGGVVQPTPGVYIGNFVIRVPVDLRGGPDVVLRPADLFEPTLTVLANDVTVGALTVENGRPDRDTVVVGSASATTVAAQPHRVRLATQVVSPSGYGHRGYALHGVDITLDGARCLGFLEQYRQSQCVWINNGPGPYTITRGVFEGSGENLLVGGADPAIPGVVPADITITQNVFRKPQAWRTSPGSVANLLELKNARRVRIEGNTFDGVWADVQAGHAIQFTVRNQDGACTWCVVDEVTFRGNVLTNLADGFAVNILGSDYTHPSGQTTRLTIDHNLFLGTLAGGVQILNGVTEALILTHNTFPSVDTKLLSFSQLNGPVVTTPLTFVANVAQAGAYGITGDGTGVGLPTLATYTRVVAWDENLIEHHPDRTLSYPGGTGNTYVAPGGLASLLHPTTFKVLSGTKGY